jgi:hypothetical protein
VRIRQEKSEKERLKNDFRARLDMNNQHWEKNLVCTADSKAKKKNLIFTFSGTNTAAFNFIHILQREITQCHIFSS